MSEAAHEYVRSVLPSTASTDKPPIMSYSEWMNRCEFKCLECGMVLRQASSLGMDEASMTSAIIFCNLTIERVTKTVNSVSILTQQLS